MKKRYNSSIFLLLCLFASGLISCDKDTEAGLIPEPEGTICKVALILPLDNSMKTSWKNVVEMASENITKAQNGLNHPVRLEVEWYDENKVSIPELTEKLAGREDIAAIIGPYYSSHSSEAAYKCAKTDKTLFSISTSAELIRIFSQKHSFLWALSETDISQCEILLSKVLYYQGKSVSLIANDDFYGKTFVDWFGFQARELGLEARGIHIIEGDPRKACHEAYGDESDYIIVAASSADEVNEIVKASHELPHDTPSFSRLLFSDTAFSPEVLTANPNGLIEGIAVSADPTTGFATIYETRFGEAPVNGVPQIYDALMLSAMAAFVMQHHQMTDMNEAIKALVDGRENCQANWRSEDMARAFNMLAQGSWPDIEGCTGNLEFDSMVYTNVLHSCYCNWIAYEGQFTILDYSGSNGSNRVDPTLAGWNWRNHIMQDFQDEETGITYPELKNRWALLIAASTGWNNYRHQADIFAIYQRLKLSGYDDDHIVLIAEDDVAGNPANPYPGQVFITENSKDVRSGVKVDYKLSQIAPADLEAILTGKDDERLPEVIHAGRQDNILIFWSGHGLPGELCWGERPEGFTTEMAMGLFRAMQARQCYRKVLGFIETCYSGSVLKASEGIPGMLFFTSANENETSKADLFSHDMNTYLSNRFSRIFIERITEQNDIPLRELYLSMFKNTLGSHVMIYNAKNFDNIYKCSMKEFL